MESPRDVDSNYTRVRRRQRPLSSQRHLDLGYKRLHDNPALGVPLFDHGGYPLNWGMAADMAVEAKLLRAPGIALKVFRPGWGSRNGRSLPTEACNR